MSLETALSILGLLGIGGIIGSYFQYIWNQKRQTEEKIQGLNENKYRSSLIFMRCALEPKNYQQFDIEDPLFPRGKSDNHIKDYCMIKLKEFYYNSILYASDEVLKYQKLFLEDPSELNYFNAALAMRRDLWKRKTKADLNDLILKQ